MTTERGSGRAATHRVLILGAGYAGMSAAVQLAARIKRREDVRVTLVNAQGSFTERLRLPMVATGQRLAELNIPRLLEGTGVRFVRGWVTAVDADARTVRVDDERVLRYDTLVYGLGALAHTAAVPGVAEYAHTLDGAQDAEALAGRLARLGGGTVVVGGSGPTGVETAAAHRAREHVRARRPRFTADRTRQREVTERFFAAATGGDINTLMELLSPDVTLWTDGGGKVRQAMRPVVGVRPVAAWFAAIGTVSYQGIAPPRCSPSSWRSTAVRASCSAVRTG
ncbi:FAD-dependent oxidoreductase [Plantactinospora veratri]|uniref:FAD-dependent oxidoreductase n=1 Tax=Plantactinospora veratri TaxID=1436122 RepID=A0ABU7SPL5_9ACTN